MKAVQAVLLAVSLAANTAALAHGDETHAPKEKKALSTDEKSFGREGDPRSVTRTIKLDMNDTMRFNPSALQVRRGETVRFEVGNSGKMQHEMVLGTLEELKSHSEWMQKYPGMEHGEPYMAHVAPGKTQALSGPSRTRGSSTTGAWWTATSKLG